MRVLGRDRYTRCKYETEVCEVEGKNGWALLVGRYAFSDVENRRYKNTIA